MGDNLVEAVCSLYPQLRHHIDYVEFSSPLTNNYYFEQQHGETYGVGFGLDRFNDPMVSAKLRPNTDVEGLFLAGEAVICPGIVANGFSGFLTAGAVLGRNLVMDLVVEHGKTLLAGAWEKKAKKMI